MHSGTFIRDFIYCSYLFRQGCLHYRGSIAAILTNFVLAYIIVPIPALDYVLMHSSEYANAPHHTFEFVLAVMSRFGAPVNAPKCMMRICLCHFLQMSIPYTSFLYGLWPGLSIGCGFVDWVHTDWPLFARTRREQGCYFPHCSSCLSGCSINFR